MKKIKKFSLIELLVVIAIIGILSSLLLPALGDARKKSKIAVCVSNLKQISISSLMLTDDNNGYFHGPNQIDNISWDGMLGSYDFRNLSVDDMKSSSQWDGWDSANGKSNSAYECPLDEREFQDRDLRSYLPTQGYPNGNQALGVSGYGNTPGPTGQQYWYYGFSRSIDTVPNAASAGLYAESTNEVANPHLRYVQGGSYHNSIAKPSWFKSNQDFHGNAKYNFAHVDGHVRPYSYLQSLSRTDGSTGADNDTRLTVWDITN